MSHATSYFDEAQTEKENELSCHFGTSNKIVQFREVVEWHVDNMDCARPNRLFIGG